MAEVASKEAQWGALRDQLIHQSGVPSDLLVHAMSLSLGDRIPFLQRAVGSDVEFTGWVSQATGLPVRSLSDFSLDPAVFALETMAFWRESRILPLFQSETVFWIGTDNPFGTGLDQLSDKIRPQRVATLLIAPNEITSALGSWVENEGVQDTSPIDQMLLGAIGDGGSDVHLYRSSDGYQVRVRRDGVLRSMETPSLPADQLASLIKLKAGMDIAQYSVPQDGRMSIGVNECEVDIRVASCPTVFGEDFSFRIFRPNFELSLESLGFSPEQLVAVIEMLALRSGLILVTGSTGSGKSTTLYSMLKALQARGWMNVVSLEDPVEVVIPGVRQSPINDRAGYGFAEGLRSVLRQDPDVIMLGEIRDAQTAKIALSAAHTGHLVLSTLHTNDGAETFTRLRHFELDPYLVVNGVVGVVSQRLVGIACGCGKERGCSGCGFTGLAGRRLVAEVIPIKKRPSVPAFLANPSAMMAGNLVLR